MQDQILDNLIVDRYNVEDGDTVIIHVPVDGLDREKAQHYLGGVLNAFESTFEKKGEDKVKFFVFPHHPGNDRPSIQVIEPPKKGSTVIFNVPIGHVPKSESASYLKLVKQQLLSEGFEERYPGCHIMVVGVFDDGKRIEVKVN